MGAIIQGIGIDVPQNIVTNSDLEKLIDTTDEWITSRTGIKQRHIVPKDSADLTSDLGARAAKRALEHAGVAVSEVDGIINASINPDKLFPSVACYIQAKLGAKGFAFDVVAACGGFSFAMTTAASLIASGQCKKILVVGSEIMSRIVDWEDRGTCILFGDGAGAVLLSAQPNPERGILCSKIESDGESASILYLNNQYNSSNEKYLRMNGQQVFKMAVNKLSAVLQYCLDQQNLKITDLKKALFHQANIRILSAVSDKLGLSAEQCPVNVHQYGNTSSASVPILLYETFQSGQIQEGDLVSLAGIGGGMSWGCNLLRW